MSFSGKQLAANSDRVEIAMRFNLKEERYLKKNLQTLELEKTYSANLIDLNKRIMRMQYKRLKDRVSKIKSNLNPKEISEYRKQETDGKLVPLHSLQSNSASRIEAHARHLKLNGYSSEPGTNRSNRPLTASSRSRPETATTTRSRPETVTTTTSRPETTTTARLRPKTAITPRSRPRTETTVNSTAGTTAPPSRSKLETASSPRSGDVTLSHGKSKAEATLSVGKGLKNDASESQRTFRNKSSVSQKPLSATATLISPKILSNENESKENFISNSDKDIKKEESTCESSVQNTVGVLELDVEKSASDVTLSSFNKNGDSVETENDVFTDNGNNCKLLSAIMDNDAEKSNGDVMDADTNFSRTDALNSSKEGAIVNNKDSDIRSDKMDSMIGEGVGLSIPEVSTLTGNEELNANDSASNEEIKSSTETFKTDKIQNIESPRKDNKTDISSAEEDVGVWKIGESIPSNNQYTVQTIPENDCENLSRIDAKQFKSGKSETVNKISFKGKEVKDDSTVNNGDSRRKTKSCGLLRSKSAKTKSVSKSEKELKLNLTPTENLSEKEVQSKHRVAKSKTSAGAKGSIQDGVVEDNDMTVSLRKKRPSTSTGVREPATMKQQEVKRPQSYRPRTLSREFSSHSNAEKETSKERTSSPTQLSARRRSSFRPISEYDESDEDVQEEILEELLLEEHEKAAGLDTKVEDFMVRLTEYLKENSSTPGMYGYSNRNSTETLKGTPRSFWELQRRKSQTFRPGKTSRSKKLPLNEKVWKDIRKCHYLRVPECLIDFSGFKTLATDNQDRFRILRAGAKYRNYDENV